MNQDEVLATLHRVVQENKHYTTWTLSTPHLVALVREVIEQEREACAKVCDVQALTVAESAKVCAEAIRARGQA
jgi:hypothetical protein